MGGLFFSDILYLLPAILIGITVHEYAHGRMAYYLGDATAKASGRLTLNPIDHMDPIGLIMIALVGFGWAKPVPVNPVNFRRDIDMKQGMLLVSLAGPLSNIIIAFLALAFTHIYATIMYPTVTGNLTFLVDYYAHPTVQLIILINIYLALFNLIPVPPLDGSKILHSLLPRKYEYLFNYLEQYGFIILILLLVTGVFGMVLHPLAMLIRVILYLPFTLF